MNSCHIETSDIFVELGASTIINGVSLRVQRGESVGIIGPNGSGKTTLFNALNGFVALSKGTILLGGTDISQEPADVRANLGMARVFQNSGIFKEMSLLENMVIALESKIGKFNPVLTWSKKYKSFVKTATEMLAEVNLEAKLKDKASSLSGGQMRLLEIVRALAFGADIFLLDEPTAGVSPRMKDQVVDVIKKLKNLGKTVLIIEHDINLIQRFCERIVVLDAGKIVLDGTPAEIRESPALQEIYFGVSQT